MIHMSLRKIQTDQAAWSKKNFGIHPSWQPLLGVSEEVGELCHAYLKRTQAIRNSEDHDAKLRDAVGDLVIYLCDFCSCEGIDLEDVVNQVWQEVRRRDWKKNPDGPEGKAK